MQRRRFLGYSGSIFATTVAGCISTDDSSGDGGADGDENTTQSIADAFPDPTVVDLRRPEANGVSTEDQRLESGRYEFSVTVENTGMAGDIRMTLVLLEERGDSIWSPMADEAGSYERFFSDGERRTETFTAELGQHKAYGFRLIPAEAEVDVRNDGGSGDVTVELLQDDGLNDGAVLDENTVEVPSDSTQTVDFTIDSSFYVENDVDEIGLDAEARAAATSE